MQSRFFSNDYKVLREQCFLFLRRDIRVISSLLTISCFYAILILINSLIGKFGFFLKYREIFDFFEKTLDCKATL